MNIKAFAPKNALAKEMKKVAGMTALTTTTPIAPIWISKKQTKLMIKPNIASITAMGSLMKTAGLCAWTTSLRKAMYSPPCHLS